MIITFNSTSSDDASLGVLHVIRTGRPILPGTRDRVLAVHGKSGVYDFGYDRLEIEIPVRIFMRATSNAELRTYARAVAAWLNVDEAKELTFDDDSGVRYMARPWGPVNASRIALDQFVDVSFLVPDGYAEATSTKTGSYTGSNDGTLETPCVVSATVSVTTAELKFVLQETEEYVMLERALYPGSHVAIDTQLRTVKVDGIDALGDLDMETTYFKLPKSSDFEVTSSPATASLEMEITWRERWPS